MAWLVNGEVALLGWAFGIASGLFAIFCVVAAVRLSRRSFPAQPSEGGGERGGRGRPAWARPDTGAASRQSFAAYHRRLRRAELRRYLKGNHIR